MIPCPEGGGGTRLEGWDMGRMRIDRGLGIIVAAVAVVSALGCTEPEAALRVALLALKIFAGLVVAVLVFLPLMASLTTIRAGFRRLRASRKKNRDSG